MLKPKFRALFVALACALSGSVFAAKPAAAPAAPVAVELAHNLSQADEGRLQQVIDRFNEQTGSSLKLVRLEKGARPAVLNLIRRYDLGDVVAQPRAFMPLHEMMSKVGQPLKFGDLAGDLRAGAVDGKGRLVALPVLYSTPVLFYNKNAFRKAKLDPEAPPTTWFEMQSVLDRLQAAGYSCPYTSSWPVWVHIDNVSAISGLPATTDNGRLSFNGLPQVKHVAMMATWVKAGYFRLFGRGNEASAKFHDGSCAMITTNSSEHVDFQDAKGVELGVAPLPYHDDVYGGRRSSLADGGSLWIGAGYGQNEYRTAAKFVDFVLSPKMQVEIVRLYGGLPMTAAARAASHSALLRDGDRTNDIAYASLGGNGSKPALRVANIDAVSVIANGELEAVWAGKRAAKEGLDNSVAFGNAVLGAKPALARPQPF